jgi:hypothetical protein
MMDDGNDEVRGTFLRFSFFDPRVLHHNSHARACSFLPPIVFYLSTILRATVTNQGDHLSSIRALEDSFDV